TLLSEWIPRSERRVSWVSLDKNDNDPVRFWTYVTFALRTLREDMCERTLALLQSPTTPSNDLITTTLANEINAFPDAIALVLDDYHTIELPAIHEAVALLLERLPRNMHIIILSRADPVLPLSRLRAQREMTEFRADDLRFTQGETASFLGDIMKIDMG